MDKELLLKLIGLLLDQPTKTAPTTALLPTVGQPIFVRTVTHHYTGEVVACNKDWIRLRKAAWIASDGRFSEALHTGRFAEVEPYPGEVTIGTGGILDWSDWPHELPTEVA